MRQRCSINGALLTLLLFAISPVTAKETTTVNCVKHNANDVRTDDIDCASEHAYAFGQHIQTLVETKNLQGLFELVNGELRRGPRKKMIIGKQFSNVFSDAWRADILKDIPPKHPVGWRGYTLANGAIWFDKLNGKWAIFAINGAKNLEIQPPQTPLGWSTPKGLIPPQCFVKEWLSSDNFEAFEAAFDIPNKACGSESLSTTQTTICKAGTFRQNPGLYLGKNIPTLDAITPTWSVHEKITLAAPLDECLNGSVVDGRINAPQKLPLAKDPATRRITSRLCEEDVYCTDYAYGVLGQIPTQTCTELAPHLKAKCESAYLLEVGDYSGGTIGWQFRYIVYGLFAFQDEQRYVVPLKTFPTKNDGLNYLGPPAP